MNTVERNCQSRFNDTVFNILSKHGFDNITPPAINSINVNISVLLTCLGHTNNGYDVAKLIYSVIYENLLVDQNPDDKLWNQKVSIINFNNQTKLDKKTCIKAGVEIWDNWEVYKKYYL